MNFFFFLIIECYWCFSFFIIPIITIFCVCFIISGMNFLLNDGLLGFQEGITEEQMLKFMGANTHLSPLQAKKLLEVQSCSPRYIFSSSINYSTCLFLTSFWLCLTLILFVSSGWRCRVCIRKSTWSSTIFVWTSNHFLYQ